MTKITLKPGDYVRTEGMTEEQYHAVAKAFMGAGAAKGEYPRIGDIGGNWLVGWGSYGIGSSSLCHSVLRHDMYNSWFKGGRQLTLAQILGTEPDADGWIEWHGGECPVEKGVAIDTMQRGGIQTNNTQKDGRGARLWRHGGYISDIIAYRIHQPRQEESPMTIEQLLAKANKHAAKAAKYERKAAEHEAKRADLFAQAAELIPAGYVLREMPNGDAGLISEKRSAADQVEDMQDPANWKAGDVVECVGGDLESFTKARQYTLSEWPSGRVVDASKSIIAIDDYGDEDYAYASCFKWISRPSAQG